MRELTARFSQSAPCHLIWTGPPIAAPSPVVYMLTIAVADGGRRIDGCNVNGVFFDCNQVVGISGVFIGSVVHSQYYLGVAEARGVPYANCTLTAGSQNITVPSSAGMGIGQAITSPSSIAGGYVAAIIDPVTIQSSAQAVASATETVLIGGECVLMDCISSMTDTNDCQFNELWLICNQERGAQYSYGPCIVLNGSSNPGSGPGFLHYGNTSINTFREIVVSFIWGAGLVVNNTDHNFFEKVNVSTLTGVAQNVVLNGWIGTQNGGARLNTFDYGVGLHIYSYGTETGGFTSPASNNNFRNLDIQNGSQIAFLGTGSSVAVSNVAAPTLLSQLNGTAPVVAQFADSSPAGGNPRGFYSVDLQVQRTLATQVASGAQSTLGGGSGNTVTGQYAVVSGGDLNTAGAIGACVPGGAINRATASYSVATGSSALADLYAAVVHSGGDIASGRQSQHVKQILRASSATNITPVRLTADGLAASALNTANLTYSMEACSISVQLIAMDTGSGANIYSWLQPLGLLRRNGTVGNVVYVPGTPVIVTSGTTTGIAITEAADTVNGAYSITFTPPTGNTSVWRVVATIEFTRLDGA